MKLNFKLGVIAITKDQNINSELSKKIPENATLFSGDGSQEELLSLLEDTDFEEILILQIPEGLRDATFFSSILNILKRSISSIKNRVAIIGAVKFLLFSKKDLTSERFKGLMRRMDLSGENKFVKIVNDGLKNPINPLLQEPIKISIPLAKEEVFIKEEDDNVEISLDSRIEVEKPKIENNIHTINPELILKSEISKIDLSKIKKPKYSFIFSFMYNANRASIFEACLKNIKQITKKLNIEDLFEICVCELGETKTLSDTFIEQFEIKYFFLEWNEVFHRALGLNLASNYLAEGTNFILTDGDLIFTEEWFNILLNEKIKDPLIGWSTIDYLDLNSTLRFIETLELPEKPVIERSITPAPDAAAGGVTIIPQRDFFEVKGIPEFCRGTWGGEDNAFLFKLKAFRKTISKLNAKIFHLHHTQKTKVVDEIRMKVFDTQNWNRKMWLENTDIKWGTPYIDQKIPEIAFCSRMMHVGLGKISQNLLADFDFPKFRLRGFTAEGYLDDIWFKKYASKYVINIDEDAFLFEPKSLLCLLEYMDKHGYAMCGVPDGGAISHRFHHPMVPNPFFNIFNVELLKNVLLDEKISPIDKMFEKNLPSVLKKGFSYKFDLFEPFYPHFLSALKSGLSCLYLDSEENPDTLATIVKDQTGNPFLIHTWYARRFYEEQDKRERINSGIELAINQKNAAIHRQKKPTPIFIIVKDRLTSLKTSIESYQKLKEPFEIIIHDNNSSFEPTIQYLYELEKAGIRVYRNKQIYQTPNAELMSISETIEKYFSLYPQTNYIVTDPDIELVSGFEDILSFFKFILKSNTDILTVGPQLLTHDIPDFYPFKDLSLGHNYPFWDGKNVREIEWKGNLIKAKYCKIDTTFQMFRAGMKFTKFNQALRIYPPYAAKHLDWYLDPDNLTQDQLFYAQSSKRLNISNFSRNLFNPEANHNLKRLAFCEDRDAVNKMKALLEQGDIYK